MNLNSCSDNLASKSVYIHANFARHRATEIMGRVSFVLQALCRTKKRTFLCASVVKNPSDSLEEGF
jgi:hypothetical protein